MKYTKEQRQEHYRKLRLRWAAAKKAVEENPEEIAKLAKEQGISPISYYIISSIMRRKGLEGFPVLDAKTFNGWKGEGFKVKKGEKAFGHGITWIAVENDEEETKMYPKAYALFHRSQVEPR